LVDVSLWGVEPEHARKAVNTLAAEFQTMHRDWHAWEPGALTDLNQALTAGKTISVKPSLLALIERSKDISARSDELFNPAIGKLIALWGFHSEDLRKIRRPPCQEAIAELVALHPQLEDVEIDGLRVRSRNPAVQLDFGAIAKGYVGEIAIQRLREMGVHNALLGLGGGLIAIGQRGDRPWRVGIRHPQGEGIIAGIDLRSGESVHTSGNYERYNEYEGVRYPHIIDPRTGMPVRDIVSATVLHDDGMLADAAATALVVAGPQDWYRIAKQLGIKHAMLVNEQGTLYISPQMLERMHLETLNPGRRVVSEPL
jgi:thiamine biosynthesis lipoprotein